MASPAPAATALHNFSVLPVIKAWGNRRLLRCVKEDGSSAATATATGDAVDDGLDRVREKLMVHLRRAADKIGALIETAPAPREKVEVAAAPEMPWKLRTTGKRAEKSTGPTKRRKFSVGLSREEVDEDLFSMTGKRASKRPKKRPRAIKNQLDQLFPGYALTEVTPAIYKVRQPPPPPPPSRLPQS